MHRTLTLLLSVAMLTSSGPCVARSSPLEVSAGGRTCDITEFAGISYVSINTVYPVEVSISGAGARACTVSPHSRGVRTYRSGRNLNFVLPTKGQYVVETVSGERVFLFADEPANCPDDCFSLTDFVSAYKDGDVMTEGIQAALDAASGSGKTLRIPPGRYLTGALTIHSDTELWLDEGAILQATSDPADFPVDLGYKESDHIHNKAEYTDNGERMTFSRMILVDGAENVSIRGYGLIDGNGSVLRQQGKPSNLIRIRNSRNVLLEGIVLRNPAAWNTHILNSDSITLRNVKIINDAAVKNTDGIDPDSSSNVLVEDCFAWCGDDNVAVKTTGNSGLLSDVRNVVVRNCVFLTRKSALKVGTETKGRSMSGIVFENNDILLCDRAFVIYCYDGAEISDVEFKGNTVERNYPDNERRIYHIVVKNRSGLGSVDGILIKDCKVEEPFPNPSEIRVVPGSDSVKDIRVENCNFQ